MFKAVFPNNVLIPKLSSRFISTHVAKLLPPMAEGKKKRTNTLVLDLDLTLICSTRDETIIPIDLFNDKEKKMKLDKFLIKFEEGTYAVYVRPGVDTFLQAMHKFYELVVFTSGIRIYAENIVNFIDPHRLITHRLSRDALDLNGYKNLDLIGRDLKHTLIIDDNVDFMNPRGNCILIKPFDPALFERFHRTFEDTEVDTALNDLIPILKDFAKVDDIRPAIKSWMESAPSSIVRPEMVEKYKTWVMEKPKISHRSHF